MNKPTFFKFFDSYAETLRACKTHKDRSNLLLAMLDYWDFGTLPQLSDNLQDKWRFIHHSLKMSRKNAYAAIGKNSENDEEKSSETVESSSSFQQKIQNNKPDIQQVNENTCAQTVHDVSTYRIKNIEEKNIDNDSDRSIGDSDRSIGDSDRSMGSISDFPDEWDDVLAMLHSQPDDDESYLNPSTNPNPNPSSGSSSNPYPNPSPKSCFCSCSNQSTTQSNPSESQSKPESHTNKELDDVGARILERIASLYKEHGRAVSYTHVTAEKELGVEKTLFYQAIKYLEATNQLHKEKVPLQDGKVVNYYTPTVVPATPMMKVLGPDCILQYTDKTPPSLTHYCLYLKDHPFLFDDSWEMPQFLENNAFVIDTALKDLSHITTSRKCVENRLWSLVSYFAQKGGLVDAN